MPRIRLLPDGITLEAPAGASLGDLLFAHGVEQPCGGRGRCAGCRVQVLDGCLEPGADDRAAFTAAQLGAGWRLGCRARVQGDLAIALGRWTAPILADDSPAEVVPRDGYGIAIDLGSTTLVAQLVDRRDGRVLGVQTALNPQARRGADIMTRLDHARRGGAAELRDLVRGELARLVAALPGSDPPRLIVIAGNTAMHHLVAGLEVTPLTTPPYEPTSAEAISLDGAILGIPGCPVRVLPCLGGFVGGDILAGILATGLHHHRGPAALVDLGTNGELVVTDGTRMLCASTAAGPAFEGASISCGMRAATGAIAAVTPHGDALACRVLGGGAARGICGSGLVDACVAARALGWIDARGRIQRPDRVIPLTEGVALTQADIRQVQMAKGAIAAGLAILLARLGLLPDDLGTVWLAGAFGNAIDCGSAHRLGLLPVPPDRIRPAGNTALLGARLALHDADHDYVDLRAGVTHVALKDDPGFEDAYIAGMGL